jgi:hypothetical protein
VAPAAIRVLPIRTSPVLMPSSSAQQRRAALVLGS